jgi:S-(hydroxymethyl)glutathione dehydrogenase/alcohol dehydrogenase
MDHGGRGGRRIRAAVAEASGVALRIEELTLDAPRAGEVLVRMLASGVCHSDLHVRDGEWQRPGPVVLGHEGSGVVEGLGPGTDGPQPGSLVALSWYAPCGRCRSCRAARPWLCSGSSSLRHRLPDGRTPLHRADGAEVLAYCGIATFGEAIVVPVSAAIPMPAGVSPEVAALIGCCVSTGVGAVRKTARVPAGASVVVLGLGGVGLSVVMGAVLAEAGTIVAVDRVDAKLDRALDLGATHAVRAADRAATDTAIRSAAGDGPDFVFEAIGLQATIEQALDLLPAGGTAVLVGMTAFGARASFEVFPFVDGARSILGSNYGAAVAAEDFPAYGALHLAGRLPIERLIDHRIGLEDVEPAFERMRRGDGVRSVIVHRDGLPA